MLYSMLGRNLEAFQIERRGEIVGEYRGERRTEKGRQYIEFFEKKDILQNDVLIDKQTHARYTVIDLYFYTPKHIPYDGGTNDVTFKVYYIVETQQRTTPIYNIGTATNSIIGSQTNANVYVENGSLESIEKEIEKCSTEDKALLYELLQVLIDYNSEKKKPKKGGLKKFESVILKYVPLASSISQFFMQLFIH